MNDNSFKTFQTMHTILNEQFGTILPWNDNDILTLEAFQMCFDIYTTKESFEENVETSFEELVDNTAALINGYYVFFNDCNYNWCKGMVINDFTTGE